MPHTGHSHNHISSSSTLEAERADRISRLAGLERVSSIRPQNPNQSGGATAGVPANVGQIPGYFDQNGNPVYTTKMSTVGSASGTGSIGGRTTTWASGSQRGQTDAEDEDQMSMDTNERDMDDRDRYSASAMDEDIDGDGMSDDASLVGFGEGAGSTVSGPIYNRRDLAASPAVGKSGLASQMQSSGPGTPLSSSTTAPAEHQRRDARMVEGLTAGPPGFVDTAARGGVGARVPGVETAERIVKERLDDGEGKRAPLGSPDEAGSDNFYFEGKK